MWIEVAQVESLVRLDNLNSDIFLPDLIDHVQNLVTIEVGLPDLDGSGKPSAVLQTVVAMITARMLGDSRMAEANPTGVSMQTAGPFSMQTVSKAALGLTNREIRLLKKALGSSSFWIQPITRGPLETAGAFNNDLADTVDPIDILSAAQANLTQ